jgi:hypothetical protein
MNICRASYERPMKGTWIDGVGHFDCQKGTFSIVKVQRKSFKWSTFRLTLTPPQASLQRVLEPVDQLPAEDIGTQEKQKHGASSCGCCRRLAWGLNRLGNKDRSAAPVERSLLACAPKGAPSKAVSRSSGSSDRQSSGTGIQNLATLIECHSIKSGSTTPRHARYSHTLANGSQ